MAFEKFNKDMKIISALDDEPNDVGGLTAAALKAKFDEGGEALKRYINDTLIPAVVEDGATEEHRAAAEAMGVAVAAVISLHVKQRAVDARKRKGVQFCYTLLVQVADEAAVLEAAGHPLPSSDIDWMA